MNHRSVSGTRTLACVVRAGETTTLIAIPAWYGGVVLVPVRTAVLTRVTGRAREQLPGTQLVVTAHLDAATEDRLGW